MIKSIFLALLVVFLQNAQADDFISIGAYSSFHRPFELASFQLTLPINPLESRFEAGPWCGLLLSSSSLKGLALGGVIASDVGALRAELALSYASIGFSESRYDSTYSASHTALMAILQAKYSLTSHWGISGGPYYSTLPSEMSLHTEAGDRMTVATPAFSGGGFIAGVRYSL